MPAYHESVGTKLKMRDYRDHEITRHAHEGDLQ